MARPLFISIAVHKASGLPTLPGVLETATDLCAWASTDHDVIDINDEAGPVTIARIRAALTPDDEDGNPDASKLLDRPRIIVYFAGHGFAAWPDQYWILSRGPDQTRERISANLFRDTLASYGPAQIAFISDACRSAAALIGTGDAVLDRYPGKPINPQKDIFYSCQLGQSSYAVPASEGRPAYLVFSSVLLKGLAEPDGVNLDKLFLMVNRQVVTSQSLSDYLEANVPQAALDVDRIQVTQCDPGFRPLDHSYAEFPRLAAAAPQGQNEAGILPDGGGSDDPLFKPARNTGNQDVKAMESYIRAQYVRQNELRIARQQPERFNRSRSEWRAPFVHAIGEQLRVASMRPSVAVAGTPIIELMLPGSPEKLAVAHSVGVDVPIYSYQRPLRGLGETVCAIFDQSSLSLIPMFADMHTIGVSETFDTNRGLEFLSWYPMSGDGSDGNELHSAEALKGLSRGFLRSIDAQKIADQLRYRKHADPMLGVIAAYLYSAAGDIDNIKRMAYYYCERSQPIPFDIALLAGLPVLPAANGFTTIVPAVAGSQSYDGAPIFSYEATAECHGEIAGLVPILRVGWSYLQTSTLPFHRVCWGFIDNLSSAPVTTFIGSSAVQAISNAFQEEFL